MSEQTNHPPLRKNDHANAETYRYDEAYDCNLMNLSVGATIKSFGEISSEACKRITEALAPVEWDTLSNEHKIKVVRSHVFLKEKYENGSVVKMKAKLVAYGQMQDRSVYMDYLLPTAKMRLVMTYLQLAAFKGWELLKLDMGGTLLCAKSLWNWIRQCQVCV